MNAMGIIVFGLASMIGLTLLRGLVIQALWTWFVVETFGITALTLAQAIGLSLIVGFLTYQYDARNEAAADGKSAGERLVTAVVIGLCYCGFFYLLGAIVHSFA